MNKAQVLSKFFVFLMKSAEEFYSTPEGQEIYKSIRRQDMIDSIMSAVPIFVTILVFVACYFFIKWVRNLDILEPCCQTVSNIVELETKTVTIEQGEPLDEFEIPLYPIDD